MPVRRSIRRVFSSRSTCRFDNSLPRRCLIHKFSSTVYAACPSRHPRALTALRLTTKNALHFSTVLDYYVIKHCGAKLFKLSKVGFPFTKQPPPLYHNGGGFIKFAYIQLKITIYSVNAKSASYFPSNMLFSLSICSSVIPHDNKYFLAPACISI